MIDLEIIHKINIDPDNFSYIINEYEDKLYRYISRNSDLSNSEKEDLLQDIFIKIYKNINEYNNEYKFSSWIFRIAHNAMIDNFRKIWKKEIVSLDDYEYENFFNSIKSDININDSINALDIKECVNKAINMLSDDYKNVIILKYIEDYSYDDISDIIRKPIWTISTMINRAKVNLKKNMIAINCNSII